MSRERSSEEAICKSGFLNRSAHPSHPISRDLMGAAGSIAIDKDKYPAGLDEAGLKEALGDKFNQEKYLELKDEEGVSHASRQCSASRQPSPSTATDRMSSMMCVHSRRFSLSPYLAYLTSLSLISFSLYRPKSLRGPPLQMQLL